MTAFPLSSPTSCPSLLLKLRRTTYYKFSRRSLVLYSVPFCILLKLTTCFSLAQPLYFPKTPFIVPFGMLHYNPLPMCPLPLLRMFPVIYLEDTASGILSSGGCFFSPTQCFFSLNSLFFFVFFFSGRGGRRMKDLYWCIYQVYITFIY